MIIEFDRHEACVYGVAEAAAIACMRDWFEEARAKGEGIRDGRVWLSMTIDDIACRAGFMTAQQVRAVLGSLLFQGVIVTSAPSAPAPVRPLVFAFGDEKRFMREAV